MEEDFKQCKFELGNLRLQYDVLRNEWSQNEEVCHNLQRELTDKEQAYKRVNQEMEKMKSRESDILGTLEQAEEKLHRFGNIKLELHQQKQYVKHLELEMSQLEEKIDSLERENLQFELLRMEAMKNEVDYKEELSLLKSKNQVLERQLQDVKDYAEENRSEKEMLRQIVNDMREEREAAARERLEQLLSTPNNLFAEMSACNVVAETSPVSSTATRQLDFAEGSAHDSLQSQQSLGTELLVSDIATLKEQITEKQLQIQDWRKKWMILNMRAQKYKLRLKKRKKVWKEQQPEEEPHVEESVVTVVVKDGVQTGQPRVRIIETVSIATQTERVAILAAAVQTNGTFEAPLGADSLSESEDDSSESRRELAEAFADHGPSPTDHFEMDIYRSCRKLSVLPEEEGDEGGLHRNSSIRSSLSARLCTNISQSADSVSYPVMSPPIRTGKVVSCADILLSSKNTPPISVSFSEPDDPPRNDNEMSAPISPLSFLIPSDAFRQPHSFDSYLDPQQIPCSLPRQISDPTQNTVCAPPLIRRGSYIKRPRSTCRPLTLTCDGVVDQGDERVPKVRFDLTEKEADEPAGVKEVVLVSMLKPARNVSRFRVEAVDERELYLEDSEVRRRPPLIHSVVYKKSVLQDLSPPDDVERLLPIAVSATEEEILPKDPPSESCMHGSYLLDDIYPCKRRKQSDVSCNSVESSEGDIIIKSIRLHEKGECIVMRDLSGDTSSDTDIPYIDAEELAEIMADVSRTTQTEVSCFDTATYVMSPMSSLEEPEMEVTSPTNSSNGPDVFSTSPSNSSSGTFCTAVSELTPMSEDAPAKGIGLSKSPTVLKNLASFESYDSPDVKHRLLPKHIEEEDELSEISDTVTYVTVKSDPLLFSSDYESDTYVTVRSELQTYSEDDSGTYITLRSDASPHLERKHSDLLEHSNNSPYNTPPDTSSASFCTPPDTFSPLFMKASHYLRMHSGSSTPSPRDTRSSSPARGSKLEQISNASSFIYDTPPNMSPFASPSRVAGTLADMETVTISNDNDSNYHIDRRQSEATFAANPIIFDSPKLEFYETNDSVENLEAFLESEEGLREEDLPVKRNSLDSATDGRFNEKRMKRHPPLSRQNSTEEYIYLEPQDSSLNLSEEISSPSTTPDTSNKTVIFKNKPLAVSNTIDLDDDDFPISESEIIINLNGSQTEIVEIPLMHTCRSEPCIPSMGKSTLARLSRQSCSMSEDPDTCDYPAIVISTVSSESEDSSKRCSDLNNSTSPDIPTVPSSPVITRPPYPLPVSDIVSPIDVPPQLPSHPEVTSSSMRSSGPACPLPEASSVPQEAGNETLGHSDADSSDSGCKLLSLEPEPANGSPEEAAPSPSKEISLPNVLEALKSLTEDEVESRAQQLALALQTDAQTLMPRLQLRQRHRDLAEKNLEREIERMRVAMQSLQYLCTDCNSLDTLTLVRTQLDCVLASAVSVSSTAEAYGFVQSEERMAAAVAPLVRYVDSVANARLERPLQSPRSPFLSREDSRDDERVMRRRSVAAVPLSLESRRRASIPFLPRPPSPLLRNGSPSQPSSPGLDLLSRRDSTLRQRRDTRIPDPAPMAEILESPEKQSPPSTPCSCSLSPAAPQPSNAELDKPEQLQLRFAPICRTIVGAHLEYLQLARFRWPTSPEHVLPFVVSWYLLFCCLLIFSVGVSLGRRSGAVT